MSALAVVVGGTEDEGEFEVPRARGDPGQAGWGAACPAMLASLGAGAPPPHREHMTNVLVGRLAMAARLVGPAAQKRNPAVARQVDD